MLYAGVAELADVPDLGSGGTPVQVQVLSPAPKKSFHRFGERIFYFSSCAIRSHSSQLQYFGFAPISEISIQPMNLTI